MDSDTNQGRLSWRAAMATLVKAFYQGLVTQGFFRTAQPISPQLEQSVGVVYGLIDLC